MNKFLLGYAAGVVTAPAVYFVFRKPLIKHVATPVVMRVMLNDDFNEKLNELMFLRLDFKEFNEKHGTNVRRMKAQGHSVKEIADVLGISEDGVRAILISKP